MEFLNSSHIFFSIEHLFYFDKRHVAAKNKTEDDSQHLLQGESINALHVWIGLTYSILMEN